MYISVPPHYLHPPFSPVNGKENIHIGNTSSCVPAEASPLILRQQFRSEITAGCFIHIFRVNDSTKCSIVWIRGLKRQETSRRSRLLIYFFPGSLAMLCYTCENKESNAMCSNPDDIETCEPDMDTCQTIVSYSGNNTIMKKKLEIVMTLNLNFCFFFFTDISEKLSIIKSCTKNISCELQINATRIERPCDKSRPSWICTTCCYDDACNVDAAFATSASWFLSVLCASSAILLVDHLHHAPL